MQQLEDKKTPNTVALFDCSKSNDCVGVRAEVRDMIITKYFDPL